jgi:two-component system OmpR family sensor kinase
MNVRIQRAISDRRKLFALVILLSIVTLAVVGFITVRETHANLVDRIDRSLRAQAQTAKTATARLNAGELTSVAKLDALSSRESEVAVFDAKGDVVWGLPASGEHTPSFVSVPQVAFRKSLDRPFDVHAGSTQARAIVSRLANGQRIAFATSLSSVDGTVADLTHTVLLVGGIAIALLALVLWRVLSTAARPTAAMIDLATRIGNGDFAARVQAEGFGGDAERLGNALNQMTGQIDGAFAETAASEARLRRFVADASHELRTPLTVIRGYAQLCRMGAAGDEADAAIARIDREATRMSGLVDNLLLLARLDQGHQGARERVDIGALTADLVMDERVVDPTRRLVLQLPPEHALVLGNADELRRAIGNLLSNVRVHTDSDVRCDVTVAFTASTVSIVVRDEGSGMSDDDAAQVFDRFYRPDQSRSRESGGSGLGLSIAKAVIEAHGGTISLESVVGVGTAIRISIPRVVDNDRDEEIQTQPQNINVR